MISKQLTRSDCRAPAKSNCKKASKMPYTAAQLTAFYTAVNFGQAPDATVAATLTQFGQLGGRVGHFARFLTVGLGGSATI